MTIIQQTLYFDLTRDGHDYFREANHQRNSGKYLKARNLFAKAKAKFEEAQEMNNHYGNIFGQELNTEITACSSMYTKMEELLQSSERT